MRTTILVTVPTLAPAGLALLEAEGCQVITMSRSGGRPELLDQLSKQPIHGVISRSLPFGADAFAAAGVELKVVSRHGAGFDSVDVAAATARGIPVLIAPAGNGQSVAELAVGLMLAVARRISAQDATIRSGGWDRSASGIQLSGRTLGLIGFGAIGKAVARAALGLGMKVVAFDPLAKFEPGLPVERLDSIAEILPRSDVLSLHVPLTEQTRKLIGAHELALLPKGAILINTARGGLVDEAALAEAVASGHLFGAGLDTFASEPPESGNPLLSCRQVIMTSHSGGSTDAALDNVAKMAAANALAVIKGRPLDPTLCVNPETLKEAGACRT